MKISVLLVTYNHEAYIAEALNGILTQKVSFPFEVVIADDCSTDRTGQIAAAFQQTTSIPIRLSTNVRNLGSNRNFLTNLKRCNGEYVAVLDGDDYWTDPFKLQRQCEFLDSHPDYAVCGHRVRIADEDEGDGAEMRIMGDASERIGVNELIRHNYLPSCSAVFRNRLISHFPDWLLTVRFADWPFYILHAVRGDIAVLPDIMAVYRMHSGGTWSKKAFSDRLRATIEMFTYLGTALDKEHASLVERQISALRCDLAHCEYEEGNYRSAAGLFNMCGKELDRAGRIRRLACYFPGAMISAVRNWRSRWRATISRHVR